MLKTEVVIMDSPGLDMREDFDAWIDKHCQDADVFVLVVDGESTFTVTEKRFFYRVNASVAKPNNVFIAFNKWDRVDQSDDDQDDEDEEEDDFENEDTHNDEANIHTHKHDEEYKKNKQALIRNRVREQHFQMAREFLVDDIKACSEDTVRQRVFFVSARESLNHRVNKYAFANQNETDRYKEFGEFEREVESCVSDTAIQTRFHHHLVEALEILGNLGQNTEVVGKQVHTQLEEFESIIHTMQSHLDTMKNFTDETTLSCVQRIERVADNARHLVFKWMSEEIVDIVNKSIMSFDGVEFDEENVNFYIKSMDEFLQRQLSAKLTQTCIERINEMASQTTKANLAVFQSIIPPNYDLYKMVSQPRGLSGLPLNHADIVEGFKPHVEFSFSLGIPHLTAALLNSSLGRVARMFIPSYLTMLIDQMPSIPGFEKAEGQSEANNSVAVSKETENTIRNVSNIINVLNSPIGAVSLAIASMTLSKRSIVMLTGFGLIGYSIAYYWEKLNYSSAAMVKMCKRQYSHHVLSAYANHCRPVSTAVYHRLQMDLKDHVERMRAVVEQSMDTYEHEIKQHEDSASMVMSYSASNEKLKTWSKTLQSKISKIKETFFQLV
jgi:mitofusin